MTARSWVMSRMERPISLLTSLRSSSTCLWTVTSRSVVGSSAISSEGPLMIAIAIIILWDSPPLNWCL